MKSPNCATILDRTNPLAPTLRRLVMNPFSRWLLVTAFLGAGVVAAGASSGTIDYTDLLSRPLPKPTLTQHYGSAPNQFAELFMPRGHGPHRVVVLIHGGCWLTQIPGTPLMDYIAADLQRRGYAVWNIEYRRIGDAGGGYPGTFQDVAAALDSLRAVAPRYELDLTRIVAAGHSAGGQLALWAAARPHLPKTSALLAPNPLPISAVVSLAGIDDLEAYRQSGPSACGGPQTIDALVGPPTAAHRDVYSDTSPARLLPIGVSQTIVSGALDPIVPQNFGQEYVAKAKAAGDPVQEVVLPGAGHFELIDPKSCAWKSILQIVAHDERA